MKLLSRLPLALALSGLMLLGTPSHAQVLDRTFAALDARAAAPNSKGNEVHKLVVDPAGRVLIGGSFDLLNGQVQGKVARLLPSGQPDPTFGATGVGADGGIRVIVPLTNGQYLIGGSFAHYDGQPAGRVARLNADGSLDATFNAAGIGADAGVLAVAVDGQGRVLVGGLFHRFNGQAAAGLVRLSAAGVPDPNFSFTTSAYENIVYSIVPEPAGNLLVGGYRYFEPAPGYPFEGMLYRLLPSGAIDPTFTASLQRDDIILRIASLSTGKLLIGGYLFTDSTNQVWKGLQRLNADGTPDASFTTLVPGGLVRDFVVLPNQQILVGGSNLNPNVAANWRAARLQADGTIDPAFTPATITSSVFTVAAGPTGSVLVGGSFRQVAGQPTVGTVRLTAAGLPDAGFTSPTLQEYATIKAMARQSADRIVAVGNFGSVGGAAQPPVVRFTAGGILDPSFQLDPTVASAMATTPAVSIGAADQVYVSTEQHAYRLQPNGTRDAAFDDGAGSASNISNPAVMGLREQSGGRVLVWGSFNSYNGTPIAGIARLTATGAVDPTFTSPFDSTAFVFVHNVDPLPDGSLLVLEGFGSPSLRWLDANGVPLASFNSGQPLAYASKALALPDNTILVSGEFTLNGTLYQGTYKLTAGGVVAPSFTLDPGLSGTITAAQPDGTVLFRQSIYAGGPQLRRLLPTGAADPSFAPVQFGTGYLGESDQAWVFQSTGDLVVAGAFTTVNGVQRPTLARLTNIPTGLRAEAAAARPFDVFPNPAHATLTLRRATAAAATATLVDVLGRNVRQWPLTAATEQTVSLTGVPAGTYVVRVGGDGGPTLTRRVVVE